MPRLICLLPLLLAACAGASAAPRVARPAPTISAVAPSSRLLPRVPHEGWTTATVGTTSFVLEYHDGAKFDAVAELRFIQKHVPLKTDVDAYLAELAGHVCANAACIEQRPDGNRRSFVSRRGDGSVLKVSVVLTPFNAAEQRATIMMLHGPSLEFFKRAEVQCGLVGAMTLHVAGANAAKADAERQKCLDEQP